MTTQDTTLVAGAWPAAGPALWARNAALALVGTLLLWVSAKAQVPMWPVPMTMQTLVVLLIGGAYGWRLGGATMLAYLAEGAVGLPVFAGTPERGLGLAYMAGPTGGFLVGFVLSAMLFGWLVERGWSRDPGRLIVALAVASVLPFVTGVAWLAAITGGLMPAIEGGLLPFVPGAVVKAALAGVLLTAGLRAIRR